MNHSAYRWGYVDDTRFMRITELTGGVMWLTLGLCESLSFYVDEGGVMCIVMPIIGVMWMTVGLCVSLRMIVGLFIPLSILMGLCR